MCRWTASSRRHLSPLASIPPCVVLALFCLLGGCRGQLAAPEPSSSEESPLGAIGTIGTVPVDSGWVRVFDPSRADNGYTLTLHQRTIPMLLDMNGGVVHAWPDVRMKSRVRLLEDGSILGLSRGRSLRRYSWGGRLVWEFELADAFPHHDVIELTNGSVLGVFKEADQVGDTLVEVDRDGEILWRWRASESLEADLLSTTTDAGDLTHINSVQELPANRWFASGDRRFRPGNLLISARNLNAVFIVERASGDVVWTYRGTLDQQHEALMTAEGTPGAGFVQILDNRRQSFHRDRRSAVLELDPVRKEVVWRFTTAGFFTATAGVQQALANGNVLVTSTRGGRVFEVTREGEIVWQWVPPYQPIRAVRLAADHAPQLRELTRPRLAAVTPEQPYLHVDPETYRFARRGQRRQQLINGEQRTVLRRGSLCRRILLPADSDVRFGFGVDPLRWAELAPLVESVTFEATARVVHSLDQHGAQRERNGPNGSDGHHRGGVEGASNPVQLLQQRLDRSQRRPDQSDANWHSVSVPLGQLALQKVELCLDVRTPQGVVDPREFAFWEQPAITVREAPVEASLDDLTAEERAVERKHLQTMGYID